MANILDYLDWRGDISFNHSKFNEIDNIICARFSYIPLDGLLEKEEIISIKELNERFMYFNSKSRNILQKSDIDLLGKLASCKRYQDVEITKYVNKVKVDEQKQFSAVTLILPDKTLYISYRGTDNTLVGFKEDFNMSFNSCVPSQKSALKYLNKIAQNFIDYKIRIGGHSKGGNLAMYAAIYTSDEVKNRIKEVYNNDGPGFEKDIIESNNYKSLSGKIHTYIPQSSIVGRLLFHDKNYIVVNSTQVSILQHDVYTWQLKGTKLEHLENVDKSSIMIDTTISSWLNELDVNQREEFVNTLYEILTSTKLTTIPEFTNNWFYNVRKILESYKNISPKSKETINKTLELLFKSGKNTIKDYLPNIPPITKLKSKTTKK
jgi:hypothetical protein